MLSGDDHLKDQSYFLCQLTQKQLSKVIFPIGKLTKKEVREIAKKNDSKNRIGGTLASSIYLMMQGVQILRIHDVNELIQGVKVFKELLKN